MGRLLIALLLLLSPLPAYAGINLVVVEARGIALEAGQVVDGGKPLALTDGQQVTLISQDGKLIKLRGPSDKPPAPQQTAATANVALALQLLVTQETTREKAGVIRGAGSLVVPPEPWLVDVSSSGLRCLPAGATITLWRPSAGEAIPLTVAPSDRSWRARAEWPAGQDRLALPPTIPLRRRSTYVVRLGQRETVLTLIAMPATLDNDAMRAAWMMDQGCDAQVKALLDRSVKPAR